MYTVRCILYGVYYTDAYICIILNYTIMYYILQVNLIN